MKYLILLVALPIFSQNNYQVKYTMVTLFDGVKNYDAKLTFSESKSCFEYKLAAKDTAVVESQDENGNLKIVMPEKKSQKVYFDFKKKTSSEIKHLRTTFIVQDSLSLPIWTILDETKTISNHFCQKAITNFKGRTYEVWFTYDYPTKNGPWKLNGLPGLILIAQDQRREVYFEVTEITITSESIEEPLGEFKIVSAEEYQYEVQKNQREIEERLKALGDRDTKIDVKFGKVNSIEIFD